jgi:hypothetical protein
MDESPQYPARMYWRYAWRQRVKPKLFSPVRAVPSLLVAAAQFVWRYKAHTPFTELWVSGAIIIGAYVLLSALEGFWKLVVFTPPRIYAEQIEVIGNLHGEKACLERELEKPRISSTEQRRRDQVRESLQRFSREEQAVVRYILDHGEVTQHILLGEGAGFDHNIAESAVREGLKHDLIRRDATVPDSASWLAEKYHLRTLTYWVNPSLKEALEFVFSEQR